ncbi:MAG: hypothetical protein LBU60_06700 [Clostridiales bacterium]|jgi:hypothetical protein|nr:hypothetical protein [Clostridiales bacterium]
MSLNQSKSKRIATIAICVALLNSSKWAFSFIPNVEVVTLLFCTFALTQNRMDALLISVLFVGVEIVIYGFWLWWVFLYIVYWPLLVVVVSLLPKQSEKVKIIFTVLISVIFTIFFGLFSTFIEVFMVIKIFDYQFWNAFYFRYVSGFPFFATQIVSNAVIVSILLAPLVKLINRATTF